MKNLTLIALFVFVFGCASSPSRRPSSDGAGQSWTLTCKDLDGKAATFKFNSPGALSELVGLSSENGETEGTQLSENIHTAYSRLDNENSLLFSITKESYNSYESVVLEYHQPPDFDLKVFIPANSYGNEGRIFPVKARYYYAGNLDKPNKEPRASETNVFDCTGQKQ